MSRIDAPWLRSPPVRAVLRALGEGFFVGGCVRNTLLGARVSDIDMATPLLPETVVARLTNAEIKSVPTGIAHGTVTAISQGMPIEITTFRADVSTDGRRATVAFTTDMLTDAARRDFTLNALYAAPDGIVVDPLGGLPDLHARRIRFIGRPEDRIAEDALRILRFFRFHAWYGAGALDAAGLAAATEAAPALDTLARERVGWEMRKLLAAPTPATTVATMAERAILDRVLPGPLRTDLAPLVMAEQRAGIAPDWRRRLAWLTPEIPVEALRLSRAETHWLRALDAARSRALPPAATAYRDGAEAARTAALLTAAETGMTLAEDLEAEIARGTAARFPLRAADLIAAGLSPGPEIGTALKRAENAWVDADFSLDKADLLNEAQRNRS